LVEDLVPVRSLNDLAYCPRRYGLERIEGQWADSGDTEQGRNVHRRVDESSGVGLAPPEGDPERPRVARSLKLDDPGLGIVGVLDLVEVEGGEAVPIDYKKGSVPPVPEGAWEPERIQVCAQGLLLRAHGYRCNRGMLYFAESRRRVEVPFTEDLVTRTEALIVEARRLAESGEMPPPLVASPKCPRCSLVAICLPDETNQLLGRGEEVRPIVPCRDDAVPLYVQAWGASVGQDHEEIVVREKGVVKGRVRIEDTSQLVILGAASLSTPLLHTLAARNVPVALHSHGGWYCGSFVPAGGFGAALRACQHRIAASPRRSLKIARLFVYTKIRNQRLLLRRNARQLPRGVLRDLKDLAEQALKADSRDALFGIEGMAARAYFEQFNRMIKSDLPFRMDGRNRRPPLDPVNALLSFAYACLARELTHLLLRVGLEPHVGFMHGTRPGRPALALDLMEEFRPIVADSAVLTAINNGIVKEGDFLVRNTGVTMKDAPKRKFIQVIERRFDELATHPVFATRLSMRRIMEVQARLLARHLAGELPRYLPYRPR
jgi:CRISPR-associated endonuclease Cas1/CRISPR-associated protein Cas4